MKLRTTCLALLAIASLGLSLRIGSTQPPAKTEAERHDFSKVDDALFAQMAEQINLTEVAAGKLAASKGKRTEVQQFGQKMVADHTAANAKLTAAIGTTIPMSGKLDAKHQAKVDKLAGLSGDDFDRSYVQEMVKGHSMASALFEHEIANGKNENLKAYATEILPGVRTHLQTAQTILANAFAAKP